MTRVAIQLILESNASSLGSGLLKHEFHLSYLSNAPDTVWRSEFVSESVRKRNSPTHYFSSEKIVNPFSKSQLKRYLRRSFKKPNQFQSIGEKGSAPHRILQLQRKMQKALSPFKLKNAGQKDWEHVILSAGILSHFVGDLANPLHLVRDYDGWEAGQGGLHAYFETELVQVLGLGLDSKVLKRAKELKSQIDTKSTQEFLFEYIWNGIKRREVLLEWDQKTALLKKSSQMKGLKIPAERRSARDVSIKQEKFIVENLAIGAVALEFFWREAWRLAGAPVMPTFISYYFDHRPKFIEPVY